MVRPELARPTRTADDLRYWLPIVLSIVTTMLTLGVMYGKLGGRLDLIEYRLIRIEHKLMEP